MRCERAQELFSDYCEGTTQKALLVPLENHLASCGECRSQVEELRVVWSMLNEAPIVEPPPDFRENVWRRIDEAERERKLAEKRRFLFGLRPARPVLAFAAAAGLLLVLAGVSIPGHFAAAGFDLPWRLLGSAAQKGARVELNSPVPVTTSAGEALAIPFRKLTAEPARIRVTIKRGPAAMIGRSEEFPVHGAAGYTGSLSAGPELFQGWHGEQITLEAKNLDDPTLPASSFTYPK